MHQFYFGWQQLKQSLRNVVLAAIPVVFVEEVASALFPWTFSGNKDVEFIAWLLLATVFDARFMPFQREGACRKISRHRWDICRCVLLWLLFLVCTPVSDLVASVVSDSFQLPSDGIYQCFFLTVAVAFFCGSVVWSRRLATLETPDQHTSYPVSLNPGTQRRVDGAGENATPYSVSRHSRSVELNIRGISRISQRGGQGNGGQAESPIT